MNFISRAAVLFSLLLVTTPSFALTLKYDLQQLNSHNGWINYPGLDFFNASSAILTVTKNSPNTEPLLQTLEIIFPNAAKLTARDFKKVDGFIYRAVVNDAWIYRQVIVDVHNTDFNVINSSPIHIEVFVSEKAGFINPEGEDRGEMLLTAHGMLNDITSSKVVDTGSVIVNGKRVNLSLKNRLGAPAPEVGGGEGGFKIDVLWMGKGEKTIYIPSGFSPNHYDFITPIRLVLEDLTSPEGPMISVVARDDHGTEIPSPMFRLKELLEQAYGPQP